MRARAIITATVLFLFAAVCCVAQSKGKTSMPAFVTNARWVQVRTMAGDEYARNVTPEDRQAIVEVQDKLQEWGYYKIAHKQQDAEIVLVVRRGGSSAKPGVILGGGSPGISPPGVGVYAETGPSEDMLAVYDAQFGVDSAPLWRKFQRSGLLNDMPLFKEFKREVEAAKKP